jgi:MoaA/NifB/PqqE/SkfB family radical SAM enzyme
MKSLLKLSMKDSSQAAFIIKTTKAQRDAAKRREENEKQGLHIPAFMIASITQRCNLRCKGCYSHAQHRETTDEINIDRMKSMVKEARDLGISIVLLAGGEPLVRKDVVLEISQAHKDVLFPTFTNGLLIDSKLIEILKETKNVIPVISIEGLQEDTDYRRGEGVFDKLTHLFKELKQNNVFYGTSITVTTNNIEKVTEESFINNLIVSGCSLFFFIEYVPVEDNTENLALNDIEREVLMQRINTLRMKLPAFFIAFPGDEKNFGGCIASGRGFIHISPAGNVEPCPFAPFSDSNINDKSLKECIQSDFLSKIRENHNLLVDGQGGCALWEKKDLVLTLLNK